MRKPMLPLIILALIIIAACTTTQNQQSAQDNIAQAENAQSQQAIQAKDSISKTTPTAPQQPATTGGVVEDQQEKIYERGGEKFLVPPNEIISGGPPKDGIPPIDNPKFVDINKAASFVQDNAPGLLVINQNEKKFYPYNILVWHEIVNDQIGGKPLTITYCPLCATGIVFEREINNKIYDFGTSGKLYQSNLVMYDRQTNSYWSQILGKAIAGKMLGTKLTLFPSSIIEFKIAKQKYPDLKVLSTDTGNQRDYTFQPYGDYDTNNEVYFPTNYQDNRLHPKTLIYAISIENKFKAYDYKKLLEVKNLEDTLNNHQLQISVDDKKEIIVFDKTTGERIIGFNAFWFSFVTHNKDAELWTE